LAFNEHVEIEFFLHPSKHTKEGERERETIFLGNDLLLKMNFDFVLLLEFLIK